MEVGFGAPRGHLPIAIQMPNWAQVIEVICIIKYMFTKMLTRGRTGRAGTCGQSQVIPEHNRRSRGTPHPHPRVGRESSVLLRPHPPRPLRGGTPPHAP